MDLGLTHEDSAAGLFVTPIAVGGTASERYIDVQVNIGPFPGNQATDRKRNRAVPARCQQTLHRNLFRHCG